MKITKSFLLLLVLILSVPAYAQTIYYCVKDGKKIVTDRGCANGGALEQRRVEYQDMPPPNTSQGLTPVEVQKGQELDQRMVQQRLVDDQNRQIELAKQQQMQARNRRICSNLDAEKKDIITAQRARNSEYLNERHRRVNDEIYQHKCETL